MKKIAYKNILYGVLSKVIIIIIMILSRRLILQYLGNEITGIYSLMISIIGVITVFESGIGTAILFNMYKSLGNNDYTEVWSLYNLLKKLYLIISLIIFLLGLLIIPFLHIIIKIDNLDLGIYIAYIILLVSTIITYFYGAKTTFFIANRNDYIASIIYTVGQIIQGLFQIIVLIKFKNFAIFTLSILLGNMIQLIITNIYFKTRYKYVTKTKQQLKDETKKEVEKNILAMFSHKIGGLLVTTSTNIIISIFINVVALANYTNYTTILNAAVSLIIVIFTSMTSILGYTFVTETLDKNFIFFKSIYVVNYIIGFVFFIGYYYIIDLLVSYLFSSELSLSNDFILALSISGFIQFMRQTVLLMRDATGTFYYDRFKPIIEGVANIIITIILITQIGIIGIPIALIISNLLITHIIEPYVLYKYAFNLSPKSYYIKNYLLISFFIVIIVLQRNFQISFLNNPILSIILNGSLSVVISLLSLIFLSLLSREFRNVCKNLLNKLIKR